MSFQDLAPRRSSNQDGQIRVSAPNHTLAGEVGGSSTPERVPQNHLTPSVEHQTPQRQSRSPRVVTPPSHSGSKPKSRISRLSDEVMHFQKLVLKLEKILKRSVQSPEDEWRSRIIVQSAQEADHDIFQKLQNQAIDLPDSESDPKLLSLHLKLSRDYCRIHGSFHSLMSQYNVSNTGDVPSPVEWLSPEEIQKKRLAEEQEDFFVRAMRDRESEVKGINQSMGQVNEIYKDLARIVESQQERIDELQGNIQYSRANAECGLDHVEKANSPSCISMALDPESNWSGESELSWSTPFQTIQEDMKAVQMDIVDLGKDIWRNSTSGILHGGTRPLLRCATVEDVSDATYYK